MIIIIDGYNLLKQAESDRYIDEKQRNHFIQRVSLYGRRKKHTMIIIFDGGPHTWPFKERIGKVKVIYSGSNETADEVIKHYLFDYRSKDLLLVSSDNELSHYASKHDIVSIEAADFNILMHEALEKPLDNEQENFLPEMALDDTIHDLDSLMEAASEYIPYKKEDQVRRQKRTAIVQRISKQDRALLKKLNKL